MKPAGSKPMLGGKKLKIPSISPNRFEKPSLPPAAPAKPLQSIDSQDVANPYKDAKKETNNGFTEEVLDDDNSVLDGSFDQAITPNDNEKSLNHDLDVPLSESVRETVSHYGQVPNLKNLKQDRSES